MMILMNTSYSTNQTHCILLLLYQLVTWSFQICTLYKVQEFSHYQAIIRARWLQQRPNGSFSKGTAVENAAQSLVLSTWRETANHPALVFRFRPQFNAHSPRQWPGQRRYSGIPAKFTPCLTTS